MVNFQNFDSDCESERTVRWESSRLALSVPYILHHDAAFPDLCDTVEVPETRSFIAESLVGRK